MRKVGKIQKVILYTVGMIILIVGINRTLSSAWIKTLFRERLKVLNPTEYVFDFSKEEVKQAVIARMGQLEYRGMRLSGFGYDWLCRQESNLFKGNTGYFVFHEVSTGSFCYRKWDGGRTLYLEMRLYLDSLAPRQTLARMEVTKYEVFTGYGMAVFIHGIGIGPIIKDMPPTTVEEYQVLYKIGKQLGVSDKMPRINYPVGLTKKELEDTYYSLGNQLQYNDKHRTWWDEFDE